MPLHSADDRWNLFSDCFLSASASLLFSCILRCVRTVCIVQAVWEEHGVTGCLVPLFNPPQQITKSCVLSTDPCDNTACAAFEKYVNLLWMGAVHSCTIHPSHVSFATRKRVCMWLSGRTHFQLSLTLRTTMILRAELPYLHHGLAPNRWERVINDKTGYKREMWAEFSLPPTLIW